MLIGAFLLFFGGFVAAALAGAGAAACGAGLAAVFWASRGRLEGQGGESSARAADVMLPRDRKVTSNEPERTECCMRDGIIMSRRSIAGQKTPIDPMHDQDARLALIHEWLSHDLRLRPE